MDKPQPGLRYHALDGIRGLAMWLGVLLHALLAYCQTVGWGVQDTQKSLGFDITAAFIHSWRMPLFFLLAGFFAEFLMAKKGFAAAVNNRLKRIVWPFLVFAPIVLPLMKVVWLKGQSETIEPWQLLVVGPGHLWFLLYLTFMYTGYFAWQVINNKIALKTPPFFGLDVTRVRGIAIAGLSSLVGLMVFFRAKESDPGISWGLQPMLFWVYGSFFVAGILLHQRKEALYRLQSRFGYLLAAGAGFFVWRLYLIETGVGEDSYLFMAIYNVERWVQVFGFLGAGLKFFAGHSWWRRYLADSAYWVYLVHLPLVLLLQLALSPVALPAVLKFGLVVLVTTGFSLVTYHYLVRSTKIGYFLNGKTYHSRQEIEQNNLKPSKTK